MKLREWIIDHALRIGLKGTEKQILDFAKIIQQNYFTKEEFEKIEEIN